MTGKVLVMGDDTRSFLATVRSLGRRGLTVHAAPANFRAVALRSRYIAAIHDLPPWIADGAAWLDAVETLLRAERFDVIIPCNETTLLPLQHFRQRLAPLATLAIPDDAAIAILFDKEATRELARKVGVPIAPGRLRRPDDTVNSIFGELGVPIVFKPRHSYSLRTLHSRNKVAVVNDPGELTRLLAETASNEYVLERFFVGQGLGVSVLASRGRVLQAFQHHRVHETTGSSFYRISAPVSPELGAACEAIVAALSYSGVAMFEFKRNNRNEWILLEINARPWGSMPLPVALGVDFPYRWYRLLTAGEETPAVSYRPDVYGRNLVPDLRASIAELRSQRAAASTVARCVARWSAELLRPLVGREKHDVLVPDDPYPGLEELREAVTKAWHKGLRRLPAADFWRERRAQRRLLRALRHGVPDPLLVFVCMGNICRSPFAEALLRMHVGRARIAVSSAGILPQPGRHTPRLGLEAAASFGIDLSEHRSRWLTRELAEAASHLLVFDTANRDAVLDRYPELKDRVTNLGDICGLESIADPIDGDLGEFRRVYGQIATAVDKLAAVLRRARL